MICRKLLPAVSGLEKEFEGRVKAQNVDATTPESKKTVKELHSYELPEIVAVTIDDGDKNALNWIASVVKGGRENY